MYFFLQGRRKFDRGGAKGRLGGIREREEGVELARGKSGRQQLRQFQLQSGGHCGKTKIRP